MARKVSGLAGDGDKVSQAGTGKKEPEQRASERESRRGFFLHAPECGAIAFGRLRGWKSGLRLQGRPELVCRLRSRNREVEKARDTQARKGLTTDQVERMRLPQGRPHLVIQLKDAS